jgi:alpha-L-fucosidase
MCDPETNAEVVAWHRAHYGHPSVFGYKDLIPLWRAERWDPAALVRTFKQAGARYIMPVAVHHDNYDNYDSAFQPWNSVHMGPKRDIVDEWRAAALAEGLHFTVSTHQHESWDWFHREYNFDADGSLAGVPWDGWQTVADGQGKWWQGLDPGDLYVHHWLPWDPALDVTHHRMRRTNHGDWPGDREILDNAGGVLGTIKVDPAAQDKFVINWYLRTKDLIDKYHPEMLYIDWGLPFAHLPCRDSVWLRLNAHYYNASLR